MKKIFRIVSMLSLVGATLVYTSCTEDFSSDIDGLKDRVDKLESQTAKLEEAAAQIQNLEQLTADLDKASEEAKKTIETLEETIKTADVADLKARVAALESAKADIEKAIEALKSGKADKETVEKLVEDLNGVKVDIAEIKGMSTTFSDALKTINSTLENLTSSLAKKADAADVTALAGRVTTLETTVAKLGTDLEDLTKDVEALDENKASAEDLKALEGKVTKISDETIPEIEKQIKDLKDSKADAADLDKKADASIVEALSKSVDTLKTSVKNISSTIDGIGKRIDGIDEKIENVNAAIDKINESIESIDAAKLDSVTAYTTFATKVAVETVSKDLAALQASFDLKCKEYDEQFAALEKKYDGKVEELTSAIETAQKAAEDAQKTANNALTSASLEKILGVYAKEGELGVKIEALEKTDSTNLAEINAKYKEFTDFKEKFTGDVNDIIAKVLADGGYIVLSDLTSKIDSVSASVTALETAVNEQIAGLWKAINTKIRSIILDSDLYVGGIPALEYSYEYYTAKEFKTAASAQTNLEYNGVNYTLPTATSLQWNYDNATAKTAFSEWPVVQAKYILNPSSATVSKDTEFNVLLKTVRTKGDASYNYVASAEYAACEDGELTVNLTVNTVDEGGAKFIPTGDDNKALIFNLQIPDAENDTATVTSNDGRLDLTVSTVETKLVFNDEDASVKGKDLYTAATGCVRMAPQFSVDYADSIDIKKYIKVQRKVNEGEFKDYALDSADTYKLQYEFSLVDYAAAEAPSESAFAKIDSLGVLVPCSTEGTVGDAAIAALGKMPIVRVLVKDGDNVIAVGFVKVLITNKTYHTLGTVQKIAITTDDNGEAKKGEVELSNDICDSLKVAELSDFNKQYILYKGNTGNVLLYSQKFDASDNFEGYEAYGKVGITITQDTTKLVAEVKADACANIWFEEGGKDTLYVRYVLKADENSTTIAPADVLYVPVEISVERQNALQISGKNENLWVGEEMNIARLNVATPSKDGVLSNYNWTTKLNAYWVGNKPTFSKGEEVVDSIAQYKFYFAPIQPQIGNYQLVVDSQELFNYDTWTGGSYSPIKIAEDAEVYNSNDSIAKLEGKRYLDATKGLYKNINLYAVKIVDGKVGEPTVDDVIAFFDADQNGIITLANTSRAMEILNLTTSNPNDSCKFYANVGIVMNRIGTEVAVDLNQSTIDEYYFLRPINLSSADSLVFNDKADESVINVYDAFDITDWRANTQSFKSAEKAWYFAYYDITAIKIADVDGDGEADITTNYLGKGKYDSIKNLSETFTIEYKDSLGTLVNNEGISFAWNVNGAGESGDGVIDVTLGAEDTDGTLRKAIKNTFGTFVYKSHVRVQKSFEIYVPLEISYVWGTATVNVTITVDPTE